MKSSRWKKFGIILVVLGVLAIAAALVIPKLMDPNRYSDLMASQIEAATGGKVSLGHITWGIADGIWFEVDGFSLTDATAFPADLEFPYIYAKVSIIPLLAKKIVVEKLLLEGSLVRVRLEPTPHENEEAAKMLSPAVGTRPAGFHLPVGILAEELVVKGGQITLEDSFTLPGQKVVRFFTDVEIEATNLIPGKEMAFRLALRDGEKPGLGSLKARGSFTGLTEALTLENPKLKFKATLSSLNMDVIKPYLKKSPLARWLGGSVSLELNYEGDLGNHVRADGLIDLSQFTYADPSLSKKVMPGAGTKITYNVTLDPGGLTVEKMNVNLGNLSLSGRALVADWRTDPVIKDAVLSSDLSLLHLIPLIPWRRLGNDAAVIREVLKGGGKVIIEKATLPEINPAKPPTTLEALLSEVEVTARVSDLTLRLSPKLPKVENITGTLRLERGVAKVEGLRARVGPVSLPEITAKITDLLEKPQVTAHLKGQLKVDKTTDKDAVKLLRELGIEKVAGTAELDLTLQLDTGRPEHFRLEGKVDLRDFQLGTSLVPAFFEGLNADVTLKPGVAEISKLSTTVVVPAVADSPGGQFTLELDGRVENWHQHPIVTLRRFRTSRVSLPSVAPIVPWNKLGESAELIKATLLAGGKVTIENLAFSKLDPQKPPEDAKSLASIIEGAVSFVDIAVQPRPSFPRLEGITGHLNLEKGVLRATKVQVRMGPLTLPPMDILVTNITNQPWVRVQSKGLVQMGQGPDADVDKFLMEYGLKSLSGKAEIDLMARFDLGKPKQWEASGSLMMGSIRAETYPAGVLLENLGGWIKFNRKKGMEITVEDLSAQINEAPIRLEGMFSQDETGQVVVDAQAQAEGLDLGHLVALVPPLEGMGLGGKLDMAIDIHFPYAHPSKIRLQGKVEAHGVGIQLAEQGVTVKEGEAELELEGNVIRVKDMTLFLNDQHVALSGRVKNPLKPKVWVHAKSANLNLDRLLAPIKGGKTSRKKGNKTQGERPPEEKAGNGELPPWIRDLTAQLQMDIEQGHYQGQEFQNLKLQVNYERGVLEAYDIAFDMGDGQIRTKGHADLRNLEQVTFALDPAISNVPVESIAPLLSIDKLPMEGLLTMSGRLQGVTGSSMALLGSLRGNLEAEVGQGRLVKMDGAGDVLAKILTLASAEAVLFHRLRQDLAGEGIPFEKIKAQVSFEGGNMSVKELLLKSDALNIGTRGTVDLINRQLDMKTELEPLVILDKTFRMVPVVGRLAEKLTKIYLEVQGPLESPKISKAEAEGLTHETVDETEDERAVDKGVIESEADKAEKLLGK